MSNLVRANYEFWSENQVELSFRAGDVIKVLNRDDAGWWEGELQGKRGLFPSNYVEPYTAINNYRAGAQQQEQQLRWGNNNNNQQQGGWNNNNNRGNGGGSTVGTGSHVGSNAIYGNNNNGNNCNNNNNRNNNNNNNNNNRNNNNNNNNNWSNNNRNNNNGNNWNNNANNNNHWNNNYNNNNNNWNNNNNNNNNNWDHRSNVSEDQNMKKPTNLDTYNSMMNNGNNYQQQPPPPQQQQQPVYGKAKTIEDTVKKPLAASSGPDQARAKVSSTKFGVWASALGDITGMTMIGVGFCGMLWGLIDLPHFGIMYVYTGIYSMVMGVFVYAFERSRWGQSRGPTRVPWRAICYLLISIFCFFSLATLILGLCCVVVAGANIIATVRGEVYDPPETSSTHSSNHGYFSNLYQYLISFREQNKIGVLIFVGVYFASNIVLYFVILWQFIKLAAQTEATNPALATSYWVPYAKGFGNVLDFNCSIIVLPVCRTFLRMLYNRSTADQSFFARFLRGILYFVPIDKNIAFHKLIAKVIWVSSVGHTVAHFINFAWTPSITYGIFGLSPFLTGGLLCAIILLMYSSSRDIVRRGQFEIFWYNHHLFVIFFLANIFHGKNSIGPNYWKWFVGPGTLYFIERILRVYRANQKVVITSVTMMEDVFAIEIDKQGVFEAPYKEGQYIFIQAPAISAIQWHPFTISSAPQEPTVTVHIRVCGEGSWTRGLRDYLASMGPRGRPFFQLDRQGPNGKLPGKILGPDGKTLLHIDGPHSAPTQHIGEYSTAIVAGAGIGITPVASTLKSIVFHRWKYFIGQCYPDHAYFVWVCGHKDVNAFRWLIRHIKDAQDEVTHMRATNPQNMATKTFEFHIYVSSVPKDQKPVDVVVDDEVGFWGVPREDAKVDKVRCAWDEADLYRTMLCPPAHTALDDVHIWNGRPQWEPRFADIDRKHPKNDIGVMFCGNPAIGRDLQRMCQMYSKGRNQGIFKLHKENF